MKILTLIAAAVLPVVAMAYSNDVTPEDAIRAVVDKYPGEIGVAVITDNGDTVTVNDKNKYPLMSVFKLHQAVALGIEADRTGMSLDTTLCVARAELNPHTWSPMLREHTEDTLCLSVSRLLRYTLMESDNNASNLMFDRLTDVAATDSIIAMLIKRSSFNLSYTEAEMGREHSRAYANRSSPLGVACLINRLFTDSIMSADKQQFICRTLRECRTGKDRIAAPLVGMDGVAVAHKTGSGFRDGGILCAHNDAAFVELPDGRHYTLVVLVKDFPGYEHEASQVIAEISAVLLSNRLSGGRHCTEGMESDVAYDP